MPSTKNSNQLRYYSAFTALVIFTIGVPIAAWLLNIVVANMVFNLAHLGDPSDNVKYAVLRFIAFAIWLSLHVIVFLIGLFVCVFTKESEDGELRRSLYNVGVSVVVCLAIVYTLWPLMLLALS